MINILKMRKGVAMIELIFAIVIMSAIILAAPSLMNQSKQGVYAAANQEAISTVASNIEMIMTREWDEEGTDDAIYPTILRTSDGAALLNEFGTTGRRAGTPTNSQRTFLSATGEQFNATTVANFKIEADSDDIDDENGETAILVVEDVATDGDYVDVEIQLTTGVSYVNDLPSEGNFNSTTLTLDNPYGSGAASAGTTNIKKVDVLLTSISTNNVRNRKKIRLNSFSSNIGSYKLDEREF